MDELRQQHNVHQSQYFDALAEYFDKQSIPQDIRQRTRQIVEASKVNEYSHVLDVGTGVGVLIEYLLEMGVKAENIIACDLSREMLARTGKRYPGVYCWCGDVLDFFDILLKERPQHFPKQITDFDAIHFNGCFGNIWDQQEAINISVRLLSKGGRIIISHPLGKQFVASLHKQEPEIVPHLLPSYDELVSLTCQFGLELESFVDEQNLYLAVLKKETRK